MDRKRCLLYLLPLIPLLTGCALMKKSLLTGGATAAVVAVTDAIVPGVFAPALAGGVTATALTAVSSLTGTPVECAPDNIWSMIGMLIETAGMWIGLCALAILFIGWFAPGPLQFKKRK
nr:hypothetical protein [uncultured Gammaproteobacteria bacterium]